MDPLNETDLDNQELLSDFADLAQCLNANQPRQDNDPPPMSPPEVLGHFLPLLQDTGCLIGEVVGADLTGAAEVVQSGTVVVRAVGAAWSDESTSQTFALSGSSGGAKSISAYAFGAGNLVTSVDIVTDGRFDDAFLRNLAVRSVVCVPIRSIEQPIGTLEFYRVTKRAFTTDDVQFIEVMTRQLSVWIRQIQDEQTSRTKSHGRRPRSAGKGRGAELRSSPRRKYTYQQMIAPMVGERTPSRAEFFPVWCKDLSGSGFSLYLSSPPTFHNLVVALGLAPHMRFYRAEVMHVQPVERDGQSSFLVGCRFTGRVYL